MSNNLLNIAMERFFSFYKEDIDSEPIDDRNVIISFPSHFAGFHRVEVTVTQVSPDQFILSDGAKTIEELKSSGYNVNSKLRKRLELISRSAKIRVVNDFLVADTDLSNLGSSLQRFVEAAKTIGDAYLVQRAYSPRDSNLINEVGKFLVGTNIPFQSHHPLAGKVIGHTVDFFFPPNGVPGLALSVMSNPTKLAAEAWAFKSGDIKSGNDRVKVGIVYDATEMRDVSKTVLKSVADMAIPSTDLEYGLRGELTNIGIIKRA
jgi:hypothetical protein